MADLTVTVGSVVAGVGAQKSAYNAASTVTAGQALYTTTATPAQVAPAATSASGGAQAAAFIGISLNGAAASQPVSVQTAGLITIGATVVPGVGYCLSETAGKICPNADLTTGDYPVFIGFAPNVTQIQITPVISGVVHA
jgi:hypothetical protein